MGNTGEMKFRIQSWDKEKGLELEVNGVKLHFFVFDATVINKIQSHIDSGADRETLIKDLLTLENFEKGNNLNFVLVKSKYDRWLKPITYTTAKRLLGKKRVIITRTSPLTVKWTMGCVGGRTDWKPDELEAYVNSLSKQEFETIKDKVIEISKGVAEIRKTLGGGK
jgi:hypothetical protein